MKLVLFFLWHSAKVGADVARRAFRRGVPIAPALIKYSLGPPSGLSRVSMTHNTRLLNVTLSAQAEAQGLISRVPDGRSDGSAGLNALGQRVGRLWVASPLTSPGGR